MRFKGEALKAEREGSAQVCPNCGIVDSNLGPPSEIEGTLDSNAEGKIVLDCHCMVCSSEWFLVFDAVKVTAKEG